MPAKLFLRAGDTLLYRPSGLFGWAIRIHTGHKISHVEVYDGNLKSVASRDGIGVGRYPLRLSNLEYVLRPAVGLNLVAARSWFDAMEGTPYGWLDLANFFSIPIRAPGIVCSPFAAGFYRAAGWQVFPTDPINLVAPYQFLDLVGSECKIAYSPAALATLMPIQVSFPS